MVKGRPDSDGHLILFILYGASSNKPLYQLRVREDGGNTCESPLTKYLSLENADGATLIACSNRCPTESRFYFALLMELSDGGIFNPNLRPCGLARS
jgi:hypothetical protein